jgi:hypothetical protein
MSQPSDKAAGVRAHLVEALGADLVGPTDPRQPEEILPRSPSRWYLTGFLAPASRRVATMADEDKSTTDDAATDESPAGPDGTKGEAEEPKPKRRMLFPASLGLSVLLPAGTEAVTAEVSWADYARVPEEDGARPDADRPPKTRARYVWRRIPRAFGPLSITLAAATGSQELGDTGLHLEHRVAVATGPGLSPGTMALSLFVVNRRPPVEGPEADAAFAFQVALTLTADPSLGLCPRPRHRGETSDDDDDRIADLQYRGQREWAVGHGVAAEPISDASSGRIVGARTLFIPTAIVPLVQTKEDLGAAVTLGMEALAKINDGAAMRTELMGLADLYRDWIGKEREKVTTLSGKRQETARKLVRKAETAHGRIVAGVELLCRDDEVREAFCLANDAMARQARRRTTYKEGKGPAWRPFQLAFLLLSLPSVADDRHPDRELVDLIFFPTGGGKTEAYLGLAAFILVLRRMRGANRPDQGLGVAVLLRYTLRLLTLDQLGRAATLICALEQIRKERPGQLGAVRFSLGLWVGRAATPNTMGGMSAMVEEFRERADDEVPCPLTACPWCRCPLAKSSVEVREQGVRFPEVRLGCVSTTGDCPFTLAANPEGLPIIYVDDQLYRELPGFVIATVDKLAMLPYKGETAALFGRVAARDGRAFISFMDRDSEAARGERLPEGLRPPDLIIQDELHLISGPLGTMVGLYEMAVDGLCSRAVSGAPPVRPKVVASTATVRRARQQITALFGRTRAPAMFPPAGIDAADSFFGQQESAGGHGRLYVGVAAPGRPSKAVLLRVYVALLTAAQRASQRGPDGRELADAYMTLVGYFNSLRELGGMRRLVEDEVRLRCERRPATGPWFTSRVLSLEPLELTSREDTHKITEAKRRLELAHGQPDAVDVALATNMISVGVDVPRLGMMVVAGQPKTTSEYIQATSRVGRDRERPGLVAVVFNAFRPRDRSHYEHFQSFHEAFYANVEATSVTPFSGPALDRGLAGALVALMRLGDPALIPPAAASTLPAHYERRDEVLSLIAERARVCAAIDCDPNTADAHAAEVRRRAAVLFDSWARSTAASKDGAQPTVYSQYDPGCHKRTALLLTRLEEGQRELDTDAARFVAPMSMRDVEAPVPLWLVRRNLGKAEGGHGTTEK